MPTFAVHWTCPGRWRRRSWPWGSGSRRSPVGKRKGEAAWIHVGRSGALGQRPTTPPRGEVMCLDSIPAAISLKIFSGLERRADDHRYMEDHPGKNVAQDSPRYAPMARHSGLHRAAGLALVALVAAFLFLPGFLLSRERVQRRQADIAKANLQRAKQEATGSALLARANEELKRGNLAGAKDAAEMASKEGAPEMRRSARDLLDKIDGATHPEYVIALLVDMPQSDLDQFLSSSVSCLDVGFAILNDRMTSLARTHLDEALARRAARLEERIAEVRGDLNATQRQYETFAAQAEAMLILPATSENLSSLRTHVYSGKSVEGRLHATERALAQLRADLVKTNAARLLREGEHP